ncbi:MAG: ABC transporter permease, partial [Vicinamibacterales bacterium]
VISSFVYSVLLQPLPLPASDRLVSAGHFTKFGFVGLSNGAFVVYGEQNRTLSGLSIYRETGLNVVSGSTVDRLSGASVDHTFFATLGVRPALGRDFTGTDDIPRAAPVAIISDAYWRRAFGADSRAVGRSLLVDGVALEIVGVMPAAFAQPRGPAANPIGLVAPVDIWVPYQFDRARARSINFSFSAIGRLKDGVSPSMAEQDLEALFDRPFERYPGEVTAAEMRSSGFRASVRPLVQVVARDAGTVLWTLMAAVCLLLALAFVNVVMLILLETQWREREIAVRRALGASLGQLSRQFLVEGSLVGVLGGVVGLLFAAVGTRIVSALAPAQLPRIDEVGLHPIVAVSLLVVSVVLGLALAAPPFVRQLTCRPNTLWTQAADALRDVRTVPRKLSTGLVASQLALALILLTGAGLMLRTTWNLLRVEPGFRTDHLLLFNITLAGPKTPNAIPFHQQVLDRLSAVPGVVSAT